MLKVLLVDNYDSYTANLLQLCHQAKVKVTMIHNNDFSDWNQIKTQINQFDCIILSPGPGSPVHEKDVGICLQLLKYIHIPILGVCLGHQALVYVFGGEIIQAEQPQHGIVQSIQIEKCEYIDSIGLLSGLPDQFNVVRYHSLIVDESRLPEDIQILAKTYLDDVKLNNGGGLGIRYRETKPVIMAVKHSFKPFYGVQFHPESCCTEYGLNILLNFFKLSKEFWKNNPKQLELDTLDPLIQTTSVLQDMLPTPLSTNVSTNEGNTSVQKEIYMNKSKLKCSPESFLQSLEYPEQWLWLDSAKKERGRFSYCCDTRCAYSSRFEYYLDSNCVKQFKQTPALSIETLVESQLNLNDCTFYKYLSDFINSRSVTEDTLVHDLNNISDRLISKQTSIKDLPFDFIGGMVGYLGYEMKAESFCAKNQHYKKVFKNRMTDFPDAMFWNIERWIVWDHVENDIYIMVLHRSNESEVADCINWINETIDALDPVPNSLKDNMYDEQETRKHTGSFEVAYFPDKQEYIEKIKTCQILIKEGETYQVCLTTPITLNPKQVKSSENFNVSCCSPFHYYCKLRENNSATFGAFFDTTSMSILCSSPELFMKINRHNQIFMKPIKGTVARPDEKLFENREAYKREDESQAQFLKNDTKNRAENLMIVDLIRNDLNLICEQDSVHVPKLMAIETYATVHQLVTTVEGQLRKELNGVDAICNTFPPGSMTGAPKIRTIQFLEEILENQPRGPYSGVLGFFSYLTPSLEFSVVIRTAIFYKSLSSTNDPYSPPFTVHVAAGGAITILSDPEDEFDEMKLKADSVLSTFL